MRVHKGLVLNYGLEKGYYTPAEYDWCIRGNSIKDYKPNQADSKIKDLKSNLDAYFEKD
jgi:hypothetical protein